jgi:hypothetical protein
MRTRAAPSWTCPWCERVVPARETRCHCGCDRSVAEAKVASEAAESEGVGGGRALLAVALVGLCGFIFYTALRQRMQAEDAAAASAMERRRSAAAAASTAPGSAASPDDSAPPMPQGYTPPAGWIPALPRPAATPVPSPSPSAGPEGSPKPSSMEEEWERASALLEPPLQKIAAASGALQASYQRFASQCLDSSAAGAGSWLEAMRNAPLRPGIQVVEGGLDCVGARETLVGRANQLRSELNAAADTSRTNRVLPGHWRKLIAAHQLEMWEQF